MTAASTPWSKSACILCQCNCGIEIQVENRSFTRIRGDKDHPTSKGYTCEKALRLDRYQNGRHRLTAPLRRRADGSYEEIDWDTAITEIVARLKDVRERHGGDKVVFYGGGGQGNHMGGVYARALMGAIGVRYQSTALAQEKTGEALVDGVMFGGHTTGDYEHAEVVVFIGKNPWQTHSFPRARPTLKAIAADPARAMIVLDPRRTETADMAEFHLPVKPGSDAWCLAAMVGVLVQEDLVDHEWLAEHTVGADQVLAELAVIPVADYARRCGVDEDLIRAAARRIAAAKSVSTHEDLGVQQGPNSTLVSYLHKLLWVLTGNFAKSGAMALHSWFIPLAGALHVAKDPRPAKKGLRLRNWVAGHRQRFLLASMRVAARWLLPIMPALAAGPARARWTNRVARVAVATAMDVVGPVVARETISRVQFDSQPDMPTGPGAGTRDWFDHLVERTPATGAPVIAGMMPAAAIADEILADHPDRFRALWIESSNPAHSLPDSPRFREAMAAVELSVVVDVAFTETARLADYVLPASSQFEKWEATLFNVEFPHNLFHLRAPVLDPLPGTRPEPEVYAAIIAELGVVDPRLLERLRQAARIGRETYALALFSAMVADPALMGIVQYLAYETFGPTLPAGARTVAPVWVMALTCAIAHPDAVRRAGFTGSGIEPGDRLFQAILDRPAGVTITVDDYHHAWNYLRHPDRRIRAAFPLLLEELRTLGGGQQDWTSAEFPLVLSAGERRAFTANTIFRDPSWRRRDRDGALRVSPADAERLGLSTGCTARVTTERGSVDSVVEVSDIMQPGHISLPNGMGLDYPGADGGPPVRTGVSVNELTSNHRRDPFTDTPWHKNVPARVERLAAP